MSNYKIKVNSAAESKEAQELFFELGFGWRGKRNRISIFTPSKLKEYFIISYEKTKDMQISGVFDNLDTLSTHKELTIPQLKDMVVLKRNRVGDATHKTDEGVGLYWHDTNGIFYKAYRVSSDHAMRWTPCNVTKDQAKPIEKEMKEFLEKQDDGSYELVMRGDNWHDVQGIGNTKIIWQRPQQINVAQGSQLDALGQHVMGARPRNKVESDDLYREHLRSCIVTRNEPKQSINDQYAEIEKVRQASVIADAALKHIRERAETYDQASGERSAAKTASAFNSITGKDITESEVWLMLQLLKDVRQWSRESYHQDSAEDCIAYAALKAESLERKK